jgi:hypothetical protein
MFGFINRPVHIVNASVQVFLSVIQGPPAECNTAGLFECNTLLHSAYTRVHIHIQGRFEIKKKVKDCVWKNYHQLRRIAVLSNIERCNSLSQCIEPDLHFLSRQDNNFMVGMSLWNSVRLFRTWCWKDNNHLDVYSPPSFFYSWYLCCCFLLLSGHIWSGRIWQAAVRDNDHPLLAESMCTYRHVFLK